MGKKDGTGKKDRAIKRLEAEIGRLTKELAKVEKAARKRISRAEGDVAALRAEVLKVVGLGGDKQEPAAPEIPAAPTAPAEPPTAPAEPPTAPAAPPTAPATPPTAPAQSATAPATPPTAPAKKPAPAKKAAPAKKPAADKAPRPKPRSAGPTVAELRAQAKIKGIKGYSSMTKAQLLEALT